MLWSCLPGSGRFPRQREGAALSTGSYEERLLTNRQYAYARVCEGQTVIVAANNDEAPAQLNVRAEAGEYIDFESGECCGCNGTLVLALPPHSGKLLVRGGFEAGQAWNAAGAESGGTGQGVSGAENGSAGQGVGSIENESTARNAAATGSDGTQHILAETARREVETRAERLASGARFEGLLIKESIDDEAILDKITVNKVELWKTDRKPRYWTALHFTSDCAEFPEAAAKVMIADPARGGNWFVDFRCGNIKYIVFRNRVLSYEIGSETEKQAVKESCLVLGVKEEEMQWAEA